MRPEHLQLFSPHPPAECVSLLNAAIDRDYFALFPITSLFGSKPAIGYITESSIRLRKRIWYRNSFQQFLYATMRPDSGGTTISGTLGVHAFIQVFMGIWFGGVILIGSVMIFFSLAQLLSGRDGPGLFGLFVPLCLLGFGLALVRFGNFLARGESRFLTDFLIQTLDARRQAEAAHAL